MYQIESNLALWANFKHSKEIPSSSQIEDNLHLNQVQREVILLLSETSTKEKY